VPNPILGTITTIPFEYKMAGLDKLLKPWIVVKHRHDAIVSHTMACGANT